MFINLEILCLRYMGPMTARWRSKDSDTLVLYMGPMTARWQSKDSDTLVLDMGPMTARWQSKDSDTLDTNSTVFQCFHLQKKRIDSYFGYRKK